MSQENTKKMKMQQRIDLEENWQFYDPILLKGEIAFTADGTYAGKFKVGDGNATWSSLSYANSNVHIFETIDDFPRNGFDSDIANDANGLSTEFYIAKDRNALYYYDDKNYIYRQVNDYSKLTTADTINIIQAITGTSTEENYTNIYQALTAGQATNATNIMEALDEAKYYKNIVEQVELNCVCIYCGNSESSITDPESVQELVNSSN